MAYQQQQQLEQHILSLQQQQQLEQVPYRSTLLPILFISLLLMAFGCIMFTTRA
jgi:hypothetical protein